jgi:hypothetical protein
MTLLIIWAVWSLLGTGVAFYFIYTWGWGDAAWGDKKLHPGTPNDAWHVRRRKAFYLVAFWACCLNPIALILFALKYGRKVFRVGVKNASTTIYTRWYGDPK